MNKLQKALCIGAGALTLAGCSNFLDYTSYKTGTVIGEYGSIVNDRLVKSDDALLGNITANESVKLGNPTYVLKIKTDNGIYTASIFERRYLGEPVRTLESLEVAIEKGDKVKFMITNSVNHLRFGKDKIGAIDSDEIELLTEKN